MEQDNKETLKAAAGLWQVHLKKLHYDMPVQGSLERSIFRVVLEDEKGDLFVLEQIPPKSLEHKKEIAAILDLLSKKKLTCIKPTAMPILNIHACPVGHGTTT